MEPILGGKITISGNFTLQEANELVDAIRLGRIHEMKIINQEIIDK